MANSLLTSSELKRLQKNRTAQSPDAVIIPSKTDIDGSVVSNAPKKKPKFASMASTFTKLDPAIVSARLSQRANDPFSMIKSAVMRHDSGIENVHSFLLAHSQQSSEAESQQSVKIISQQDSMPLPETNDCASLIAAPALLENQFDQLDHFIKSNDALFVMKEDEFSANHATEALSDTTLHPTYSDLPFDWNLKTQLTLLSPFSFNWLKHSHESESSSLFHFTQSHSDANACSPISSMQQCLYYWIFPFEIAALSAISYEMILGTVKGSKREAVDSSLWQSAFDSAFAQLIVADDHMQYFYFIHGDLNAVFISLPGYEPEVRLRAQDRRHLKLLEDKELVKMEDFAKTESISMEQHSTPAPTEESLQVLKEMEELESLAPGSTRIHHASPLFSQQKSRQYDSISVNESPICLKGKEKVTILCQFLKEMLRNSVVSPVIISRQPFLNATLKKSQMKVHRSVKRIIPDQDGSGYKEESIHKMSIEGLVLPSSLASLFLTLKTLQKGEFESDLISEPNSAGLNMGTGMEEGSPSEAPKSLYCSKVAMKGGQWVPIFTDFRNKK